MPETRMSRVQWRGFEPMNHIHTSPFHLRGGLDTSCFKVMNDLQLRRRRFVFFSFGPATPYRLWRQAGVTSLNQFSVMADQSRRNSLQSSRPVRPGRRPDRGAPRSRSWDDLSRIGILSPDAGMSASERKQTSSHRNRRDKA